MKKRIISWLMVMCIMALLVTALPITASAETSGTCGDNVTWTLDDNGMLTISGTGDMDGYYEAPWHNLINSIKNVIIENGVFVGLQGALYSGEDIIFESDTDCDSAKVLVWGSFANLKPVTNAETVNINGLN